MRKEFLILSALAVMVIAGCSKEEDFVCDYSDNLVDVVFSASTESDESESKAWIGWQDNVNFARWNKADRIGVFAGNGNVNRMFTLVGDGNVASGKFSGQMSPVPSPVVLWAYYPFSEEAYSGHIPCRSLAGQVFKGTFEEKGTFSNYGDYSFMIAAIGGFSSGDSWPEGLNLSFTNKLSVVRFKIENSLDRSLLVKSVGLESTGGNYVFRMPLFMNFNDNGSYGIGYYLSSAISTSISEDNSLTVMPSETAYVQMLAMPNSFNANEALDAFVECLDSDGQCVKFHVFKTVGSSKSFQENKRTTVSVPLSSGITAEYASMVKLTTTDDAVSLTAPVFQYGSQYQAAETCWGDGCRETFCSEKRHLFSAPGSYTATFNHWGGSPLVTITSLDNISAIDFSQAFND